MRDLGGGAHAAHGRGADHRGVALGVRAGHLLVRERGGDDAGAEAVHPRPAIAPGDGGGLHAQSVGVLGQGVCRARVPHYIRGQLRQVQQLRGGGLGEGVLELAGTSLPHVPGHARDHQARAARGDDPPELLEQVGGAGQVDGEDPLRARLHGRDPGGDDHPCDVPEGSGLLREGLHGGGVRDVEGAGGDLVALGAQPGRDRLHRLPVAVGEEERAADGGAAGDGDADAPGTDDDGDLCAHGGVCFLS